MLSIMGHNKRGYGWRLKGGEICKIKVHSLKIIAKLKLLGYSMKATSLPSYLIPKVRTDELVREEIKTKNGKIYGYIQKNKWFNKKTRKKQIQNHIKWINLAGIKIGGRVIFGFKLY